MHRTSRGRRGPRAVAGQPGRPLRRRIGVRQALANGLTLAWRNATQLKHSPGEADGRPADAHRVPRAVPVRVRRGRGRQHARLPGGTAARAWSGRWRVFASMGVGTALCEDIHKGVFDRFRSLPVARSAPAGRRGARRHHPVLRRHGGAHRLRVGARLPVPHRAASHPAAYGLAYVFYLAMCWISVLIGLVAPTPQTVQGISLRSGRCRWCSAAPCCWPTPSPCRAGCRPG